MGISLRGYAKHRGVSHTAVQKAVASKRIKLDRDGKIDVEKADRAWEANTDPAHELRSSHSEQPAPIRLQSLRDVPEEPSPGLSVSGGPKQVYQNAKAVEASYRARLAKLEYEEKIGKLLPKDMIQQYIATFSQMVKDHALTQADRLASTMAALDDVASCHRVLLSDGKSMLVKLNKSIAASGL